MSDVTRLAALERVAEAARALQHWQPDRMTQPSAAYAAWGALNSAIAALRLHALPAPQPQGETVEVWKSTDGLVWWCIPDSTWSRASNKDATRLGTVTLPITRERGP